MLMHPALGFLYIILSSARLYTTMYWLIFVYRHLYIIWASFCMCVSICLFVFIFIYVFTHTHIHIHTYLCIHTYIIHVYIDFFFFPIFLGLFSLFLEFVSLAGKRGLEEGRSLYTYVADVFYLPYICFGMEEGTFWSSCVCICLFVYLCALLSIYWGYVCLCWPHICVLLVKA